MASPYLAAASSFQHPSTFVLHQDTICSSSSFSSHPAFPYFALLIIFSLLCLTDHLFLSALLTRPSHASSLTRPHLSFAPSRTQLHLRHACLPVPFGLPDPTCYIVPRPPFTRYTVYIHGTPAGKPQKYEVASSTVPIYPPVSTSRAHPQPLFGYCSIPATSALFEPVPVCTPSRAPFLQLFAESSTAPAHSTILSTTSRPSSPSFPR